MRLLLIALGAATLCTECAAGSVTTGSRLASMAANAAEDAAPTVAELTQMRSRQLKKLLKQRGVDTWGMMEKEELVAALIPLLESETPRRQALAEEQWEAAEAAREENEARELALAEAERQAATQKARAEHLLKRGKVLEAKELEEQAKYELAAAKAKELAATAAAATAAAANATRANTTA